jgi:hypothetical protein
VLCLLVACSPTDTPPPTVTTVPPVASTQPVATEAAETIPTEAAETVPTETTAAETPADGTPTATAESVTGLDCEIAIDPTFQDAWVAQGSDVCPTGTMEEREGAVQAFVNGTMIWVGAGDSEPAYIYVIANDNSWRRFEDTFEEGDVESAGLVPPDALLEPIRGFGLVWREQLGGEDAVIGWAVQGEVGQPATIQAFGENTFAIGTNGQVYWLNEDGTWQ